LRVIVAPGFVDVYGESFAGHVLFLVRRGAVAAIGRQRSDAPVAPRDGQVLGVEQSAQIFGLARELRPRLQEPGQLLREPIEHPARGLVARHRDAGRDLVPVSLERVERLRQFRPEAAPVQPFMDPVRRDFSVVAERVDGLVLRECGVFTDHDAVRPKDRKAERHRDDRKVQTDAHYAAGAGDDLGQNCRIGP